MITTAQPDWYIAFINPKGRVEHRAIALWDQDSNNWPEALVVDESGTLRRYYLNREGPGVAVVPPGFSARVVEDGSLALERD